MLVLFFCCHVALLLYLMLVSYDVSGGITVVTGEVMLSSCVVILLYSYNENERFPDKNGGMTTLTSKSFMPL